MKYASVCSGIEAATTAWHPLGWEPTWFSEIERFPNAVLTHRHPDVPNLGNMEEIDGTKYRGAVDILVGGTPCQSFSIAGGRKGLKDSRGNLAMHFVRLVEEMHPKWVIWENVPGVLSSNKGRDFASFLTAIHELGYSAAWRVLDAQYFGLAQRRKRVFLVASSGSWRNPAEILLEPQSVCWDSPPRRKAGEETPSGIGGGVGSCGVDVYNGTVTGEISSTVTSATGISNATGPKVLAFNWQAGKSDDSGMSDEVSPPIRTTQTPAVGVPDVSMALNARGGVGRMDAESETFVPEEPPVMAFEPGSIARNAGPAGEEETCPTLRSNMGDNQPAVRKGMTVRRLTPTECERLMGFPDGYTDIPWKRGKYVPGDSDVLCPDGPRYKALGNSMAVPVMRWIGERIQKMEDGK